MSQQLPPWRTGTITISTKFELAESAAPTGTVCHDGVLGIQLSEEEKDKYNYESGRRHLTITATCKNHHMQNTQPRSRPQEM